MPGAFGPPVLLPHLLTRRKELQVPEVIARQ